MNHAHSSDLFERAQRVIPGGVNSPVRAFRASGGDPLFYERAKGSRVWDADGNEYIDFVASWGPMILGHAPGRGARRGAGAARARHELRRAHRTRGAHGRGGVRRGALASRWCAWSRAAPRPR